MPDKLDKTIQDIAIKHGVLLGKDDPILILQTMNERLFEENRNSQQEMLVQFKEEMENISSQWNNDAKEKADKILNVTLASSKEVMSRLFQESTNESIKIMKKMILDALDEARDLTQQTKKFSSIALFSSAAIMATSCLFMLFFILQF